MHWVDITSNDNQQCTTNLRDSLNCWANKNWEHFLSWLLKLTSHEKNLTVLWSYLCECFKCFKKISMCNQLFLLLMQYPNHLWRSLMVTINFTQWPGCGKARVQLNFQDKFKMNITFLTLVLKTNSSYSYWNG